MKTMISMSTATVRRLALAFGVAGLLATTAGCAADSSEPDPSAATETPSAPTAPIVTHEAPGKALEPASSVGTAADHATPLANGDSAPEAAPPVDFNAVPGLGQPASSLPKQTNQQTEECAAACAICYSTGNSVPCGVCHSPSCRK
jgi:hypothetical protein